MFKEKLSELKGKNLNESELIRWHHMLMSEYGWIPFEEFKNLPIPTVFNLLREITKDSDSINRKLKKKMK